MSSDGSESVVGSKRKLIKNDILRRIVIDESAP